MKSIHAYNQLDGRVVSREDLKEIVKLADSEEQSFIAEKLKTILYFYPEAKEFDVNLENEIQEQFPASMLGCIDELPEQLNDEVGLGKAVKPDDIYQMITDKLLAQYKEASGSGYKKKWKKQNMEGYLIPFNWESKKPYRGINIMLLTDGMSEVMNNPFFLTFKQIEANKGKLKKGSKGLPVVYFTRLYLIDETGKDGKKIDFGTYDLKKFNNFIDRNASNLKREADFYKNKYIPIIKYYNVFNGADVEGIDFDLANFKKGYQSAAEITKNDDPRIELADAIIENYPKPQPKLIHHKKDDAFYRYNIIGTVDEIRMPAIEDFETASDYYRTLLHELTHSTGSVKRLNRDKDGKFGSKKYAKEELVAEMGAVFLSAHAGIIWHNNTNHAEYLKNWGRALEHIEKDNRFLMRAASAAQASTDFVLNYNAEGVPAYLSKIDKKEVEKETKQKASKFKEGDKVMFSTKPLIITKVKNDKGVWIYEANDGSKYVESMLTKPKKSESKPETNELKVLATSPKGALLITDGKKVAWIMKRSRRKDGTFTPGAYSAIAKSDVSLDDYEAKGKTSNKTKYHLLKYDYIVRETPKAILVRSFNGSEDWLPKVAIIEDYGGTKSDRMWVAAWALRNKNVQYSKKTQYFDKGMSAPSPTCKTAGKKLRNGSSNAGRTLATKCKTETAKIRTAKRKGNKKEVCSTSGRALAKEGTSEAGKTLANCSIKSKPSKKKDPVKSVTKKKVAKTETKASRTESKKEPKPETSIKTLALSKINTDESRFQNRKKLNKTIVNNIVENFNETNFDPLIIWLDPKDEKYYLLAGHHRFEAIKKLGRKQAPVKIANKDYPKEKDAIRFAREESNANRSLEKTYERAEIYRKDRLNGISVKDIEEKARIEGRNRSYILNLSYLNPKGKLLQNLIQFDDSSSVQDTREIEKIADWVGQARRNYDGLTNAHENEMYDFLKDKNAAKRTTNKTAFTQLINSTVTRFDFNNSEPLNLKRFKYESEGEKVYNQEVAELKNEINENQDKIDTIKARFFNPKAPDYIKPTAKDYNQAKKVADDKIAEYNQKIKNLQSKLVSIYQNKGTYINAGSNQAALFGARNKPGMNNPVIQIEQPEKSKNSKIRSASTKVDSSKFEFYNVPGPVGKFLQRVERKKQESVVITIDGKQGAGKTTMLYQFMEAFTSGGNRSLFASLEQHPDSILTQDKIDQYISPANRSRLDLVGDFEDQKEFYSIIEYYDIIFIDSWQKLIELIGKINLDKDLRKKFDSKVFVVVFQQTTEGKTKGGASIVFDGDIIIKMETGATFSENYAYFDKNRYTKTPIETLRYSIAEQKVFDPTATQTEAVEPNEEDIEIIELE